MTAPILAHGALGWWDEIIFLGVVVIFFTLMGISWVKSRSTKPEDFLDPEDAAALEEYDKPLDPMAEDDPKRFMLD